MKIQEESPLLLEPLANLEEDYEQAVLHLAWDRNAETKALTLLFAFVELLPAEIPPPLDDYDYKAPHCSHRLGNKSKHHVYLRHAVVKARAALDWYRACRVGTAVLPGDGGVIPAADAADAKRLTLATLGEDPVWPTLLSASDDTDILPFCPQWITCPRTHHLLPLADFDLGALWSVDEREEAQGWLKDHLHFDLGEYPEYWGSVHLVAPNPVYREVHMFRKRSKPPDPALLVWFESRASKSADGLELTLRKEDPWGVTPVQRVRIRSPYLRVCHDATSQAVLHYDVLDPIRGVLKVGNLGVGFIDSFSINVRVETPVRVQGPTSSYEVARIGKADVASTGAPQKVATAHSRFSVAQDARRKRHDAEAQDQRWFKGQKEEARAHLRGLLNGASSAVLLIDPYFEATELHELLAVGQSEVPIRILNSAEVLKSKTEDVALPEKGDQLLHVLEQIRSNERMNPFEIRVMTGGRPSIHDRFLAIDKRIWILGSSLNEFGSRGTMMLALPDPEAIRSDLEDAWKSAEVLDLWLTKRKQSRKNGEGESV